MRVFVAGATGVLGAAAVRGLVAGGHKVTGLCRTPAKRDALTAAGAQAAEADLFDPASLRRALAGHDVVVNLATRIPAPDAALRARSWRENDRIRAEASRNLAEAAAAEGALRLIQEAISFVYEDGGGQWITERAPVRANALSATSITATENAMAFADAYRFAVVLRFGMLYGDEPTTRWLLERVRRGKPVLMGDPEGYVSPLAVPDAGAAVVAALAARLGEAAGVNGAARFFSPLTTRLVRGKVEPFLRSQRVSSEAFHAATGWRAKHTVTEGLAAVH